MFGKHEMFLHSFDIKDTLNGEFYVTVTAKTLELFCLTACLKKMTEMEMPNSWKNLHVLTERIYNNTRPPFLEWLKKTEGNSLFPLLECDDAHIYLIEERVSN